MIALEIIEYFGAEEMVNNNTPFEEQDYAEAIKELEDLENRSCDNCKYRVLHMYYEREKATIDKCSIRKDLRFNGSCDGLKCNKWEAKNENL